jgi:hypothetical protein
VIGEHLSANDLRTIEIGRGVVLQGRSGLTLECNGDMVLQEVDDSTTIAEGQLDSSMIPTVS